MKRRAAVCRRDKSHSTGCGKDVGEVSINRNVEMTSLRDFDSAIRRFKSSRTSQLKQ